jgi:hypothetical protein
MATSTPDLHAKLRATRRELAAARRALQERCYARGRPMSSDDTVRVLSIVLQHSSIAALEELRAERDRLARDLPSARIRIRTAQNKYSSLCYIVWQLTHRALVGGEL